MVDLPSSLLLQFIHCHVCYPKTAVLQYKLSLFQDTLQTQFSTRCCCTLVKIINKLQRLHCPGVPSLVLIEFR